MFSNRTLKSLSKMTFPTLVAALVYLITPLTTWADTATAVIGETLHGILENTDSQLSAGQWFDEYTFEGVEGQNIFFNLSTSDFDAFLWLLDSEGKVIAINDDTGDALDAVISHLSLPETGTYTVLATSHRAGEGGVYTLSLNEAPSTRRAKKISLGTRGRSQTEGKLARRDRQFNTGQFYDVYTFTATPGMALSIAMYSTQLNTYLWLLDHEGRVITVNDDGNSRNNQYFSEMVFFPPVLGTYTLLASSKEPAEVGHYIISLGEARFEAMRLSEGTLTGQLEHADIQLDTGQHLDVYTFKGKAGKPVTLALNSTDFDSRLQIIDRTGQLLQEDDDSGGDKNALIARFTPPQNGYYYVWVSSVFAGGQGDYTLSLNKSSSIPTPITNGIDLILGQKKGCEPCTEINQCVHNTQIYTMKIAVCVGERSEPLSSFLTLSGSSDMLITPEIQGFTAYPNRCTVLSPFSVVSVNALAGVKTLTATVTGLGSDDQTVNVVEVGKLQYDDSGWQDVPTPLSIAKDTSVTFKAVINPSSGSWPPNKPVWGGTAGATGTGETNTVTFDTLGTQTIAAECGDSKVATIEVTEPSGLKAIADCSPTEGDAPLTVRLRSRGESPSGSIVRYRWDFQGDGSFDTSDAVARDFNFTFPQQGTYHPVLEVTDNLNNTVTDRCTILVGGNQPTAIVDANPSNGPAPLTVNFTCIGSDEDGTIALYEWDFEGDGEFDFSSPSSVITSYTYTTPGTFTAVCQVTDNDGMTGTASTINSIIRSGPPGSPSVKAIANRTEGDAPLAVSFNGTATDDGSIVLWEWDFEGDGHIDFASPASPQTNFTYTTAGTFAAALRVTDNDGLTATDNIEINVTVQASLSVSDDTFDPTTGATVTINTAISADDLPVRIILNNNQGDIVRTLVEEIRAAGNYADIWDGRDDDGQLLAQGAYYAVLEYEVNGETLSVDLTNTTGGTRYSPSRSSIPNRFSPFANQPLVITFTLNRASEVTAFMGRFNVDTRLITFMERVPLGRGSHQIIWNGENADGQLIHPPLGDSFLFGLFGYTLPNNAIYVRSGAHISGLSVAPAIFDPTGHIDDQGTPEHSVLTFELSKPADVDLVVSDAETGAIVAQQLFTGLTAGHNTLAWNGRDDHGLIVAPGRYRLGVAAVDGTGYRSLRLYVLQRIYY